MLDPQLQTYGLFKFLTFNSLILQFLSSVLHIIAEIYPKSKLLRDVIFTAFAYPIGSHVVYTFWTIYWTQGRDMIYPVSFEKYYPGWLNHVTHTIIVPVNIGQAYLTFHRFIRRGAVLTISFMAIYCLFILYIRCRSGMFPYTFMNQMSFISIVVYFGCVFFCCIALYETGYIVTNVFHMKRIRRLVD